MEAPEAAPEATPTFSAPDGEALGKVKDDALNKAQDLWKQGKAKLDKVVRFGGNPTMNIELRKHLDIRIPMAPSIRVTLGTDASVEPMGDTNNYEFKYEPNFNWGITETWFHGMIEVNTAGKEVKYSKTFDLDSLAVKVNGVYDYDNNVPYFGFKVLTTSGVSSPANSNGFSVCKKFTQNLGPIKATADVQTSVQLGEQKYNPAEKKMASSPAQVDFNNIKLLLEA